MLGGATIGLRVFSILTSIILARLLHPSDFGQVDLAQVVLSVVAIFATLGLPAAVIQTTMDREKAAFSAFVVTFVMGAFLCLLFIVAAPWLGFLLGDPRIEPVLQWLSITVLLGGATRIPEAIIQKELLFGRLSIVGIASEVTTVGVSICLAWLGWGVWSLVYGAISGAAVNAVLAFVLCPWAGWLRFSRWDRRIVGHMLGFGAKMVGSTSVYTFYSYVDNYVVGRFLGTEALGYYGRVFNLTSKTVDSVNRTIGAVLFPSYAQLQQDTDRLARAYLKSLRIIGSITIPIALGLFAVADEAIPVLLGREWIPAIPALKALTFMSLLKPLSSTTSALFVSTGHPEYNLRAGLAVTFTLIPAMFVFLPSGIVGVAWAVVLAHAVGLAYNVHQVQTILPGTVRAMFGAVLPALGGAVIMVLGIMGVREAIIAMQFSPSTPLALACLVGTGIILYVAGTVLTQRPLLREMLELIRPGKAAGSTEVQA